MSEKEQAGLQYLEELGAEIAGLYAAVKAEMPNATDDEIHEWMKYYYVRLHSPALFRVGVTFTPEQEAKIRAFAVQGNVQAAQNAILEELKKEFPDGEG